MSQNRSNRFFKNGPGLSSNTSARKWKMKNKSKRYKCSQIRFVPFMLGMSMAEAGQKINRANSQLPVLQYTVYCTRNTDTCTVAICSFERYG